MLGTPSPARPLAYSLLFMTTTKSAYSGPCPPFVVSFSTVSITGGRSQTETIKRENSRNNQFKSFKLCTVLNNVRKSCPISVYPSRGLKSSLCPGSPHCTHCPPVSHLVLISVSRSTVEVGIAVFVLK